MSAAIAFVLSLALMPLAVRLGRATGMVDRPGPGGLKIHATPVSVLGGPAAIVGRAGGTRHRRRRHGGAPGRRAASRCRSAWSMTSKHCHRGRGSLDGTRGGDRRLRDAERQGRHHDRPPGSPGCRVHECGEHRRRSGRTGRRPRRIAALSMGSPPPSSISRRCSLWASPPAALSSGSCVWNRPPARLFLGNGGAYGVGILLAAQAIGPGRLGVRGFLAAALCLGPSRSS